MGPEVEGIEAVRDGWRLLAEQVLTYGLCVLDRDGSVGTWNPGARRIFGLEPYEALGRNWELLFTPEARAAGLPRKMLDLAVERGSFEITDWWPHATGERVWARVSVTALRDEAGRHLGFGVVVRDLAPERKTVEQLELLRRQNEVVLDSIGDGIVMADPEGRVTFANPAAAVLFRTPAEDLIGMWIHDLFQVSALDRGRVAAAHEEGQCPYLRAVRTRVPEAQRCNLTRSDGTIFPAEIRTAPIFEGAQVVGAVVTVRDISAELESQARARAIALEQAARAEAEEAARWARFLAEASRFLGATLDTDATLTSLLELVVPPLGDFAIVDLPVGEGRFRRLASRHEDPAVDERLRRVEAASSARPTLLPVLGVLRTGRSLLLPREELARTLADDPEATGLRELEPACLLSVPLRAGGRIFGALTLGMLRSTGRIYDTVELSQAEDLAGRAALALENARLAGEQKEQRLRAELSEARFRAVYERGGVGIAIVDGDRRIHEPNAAFAQLTGHPAQALEGTRLDDLFFPEDRAEAREQVRKVVEGEWDDREFESRLVRRDASVIWTRAWVTRLPTGDERRSLALAMAVDVTQARQAEENARRLAQEEMGRARAEAARAHIAEILERFPDGFLALDQELAITYVNARAEELLGRSRDEVIGLRIDRAGVAILRDPRLLESLQRALRNEASSWDAHFPSPNAWFTVHVVPSANGPAVFLRDITARRQSEEALRRLAAILEATPDLVLSADPLGRLRYANAALRGIVGLRDIEGADLASVYTPEAARRILGEGIAAAVAAGSWQSETSVRAADGSERTVSQALIAHCGDDGELVGLSALARDITAQKRVERGQSFLAEASRLLASELDIRATVEQVAHLAVPALADICIVALVENDTLEQMAQAAVDPEKAALLERFTSVSRPDAPVGPYAVLRTGEAELVPFVSDAWLWASVVDEEHFRALRSIGLRSILIVPLQARGHRVGIIGLASCGRRFTEEDRILGEEFGARAAQAIDNAMLYASSRNDTRLREEVVSIVSHDLRNPLTAVALAARRLERSLVGPNLEDARKQAHRILGASQRAMSLISDLLDVSRLESGNFSMELEPVNPSALIEEAAEAHRGLAEGSGLRLEVRLDPNLPDVRADRQRLQQVFGNLIGNALRCTPKGGRIEIGARRLDPMVEFWVEDTGPGVPEEDRPHIFDRFWQASQRKGSAGLGLAISRGIVQAHGGTIDIASGVEGGARFFFRIPVAA